MLSPQIKIERANRNNEDKTAPQIKFGKPITTWRKTEKKICNLWDSNPRHFRDQNAHYNQ